MILFFLWAFMPLAFAQADLKVLTTTTDLAWLVEQVGGRYVTVTSLLNGSEDPNYIDDNRPDWVDRIRNSDLVCLIGRDLEVGWMPDLIEKTGREDLKPGKVRYCEVAGSVDLRKESKAYPRGSPYFWLSPPRFAEAVTVVEKALGRVDPSHSPSYAKRAQELQARILSEFVDRKRRLQQYGSTPFIIEYGEVFRYFLLDYGISEVEDLEVLPDYPPAPSWMNQRARDAKDRHLKAFLVLPTNPTRSVRRFQELSGIPLWMETPHLQRGEDYFAFQDRLLGHLEEYLRFRGENSDPDRKKVRGSFVERRSRLDR
jgi:zinc/manganese transport system substrate-binding protein